MKSNYHKSVKVFLLLTLILYILVACSGEEIEIPFEVLDEYDGSSYEDVSPTLILVSSSKDIPSLTSYIPSPQINDEILESVDFEHYIVAGIFQGYKPGGPAGVTVEKVTAQKNGIKIYSSFVESQGVTTLIVTSAYQIIAIEKPQQLMGRTVTVTLIANGKKVAQTEIHMP